MQPPSIPSFVRGYSEYRNNNFGAVTAQNADGGRLANGNCNQFDPHAKAKKKMKKKTTGDLILSKSNSSYIASN